jgi:hypothetical protein
MTNPFNFDAAFLLALIGSAITILIYLNLKEKQHEKDNDRN